MARVAPVLRPSLLAKGFASGLGFAAEAAGLPPSLADPPEIFRASSEHAIPTFSPSEAVPSAHKGCGRQVEEHSC